MALFQVKNWLGDAKTYARADFLAGLTLWALLVPQSIAYAKLAGAPSPLAGLYALIFVLPVYAIFASSRMLVPSPTTAVSATFAGFMAAMLSEPDAAFQALVLGTAIAYFVFWFFRLGFLTDFISMPVSLGYLSGLSIIVIIKQFPDLLGFDAVDGSVFKQAVGIFEKLDQTNLATAFLSIAIFAILIGLPKISKSIPSGLIAVLFAIIASMILHLEANYGVSMVGALPKGLPEFHLFHLKVSDFAIVIPASIGMVILASGEASVTASLFAAKYNQRVDMNQQFFAFGMGNLASGFAGGMLGTGASSASMVSDEAGAKTLMATIWAAGAAILTVLFLAGFFAYVPNAFLAALVITAVWKMLKFRTIWRIQKFQRGEFYIAVMAQISVLVFGILNGLLMTMLINVLYYAYTTSRIKVEKFGVSKDDPELLQPLGDDDVDPLPKGYLGIGMSIGQIFYASARDALNYAKDIVKAEPDAHTVVISLAQMNRMDYTTFNQLELFQMELQKSHKKLIMTDIRSSRLLKQIEDMNLSADWVRIERTLDMRTL